MKQLKIYVVACQHGDEVFGLKILDELKALKNPNLITRIANPAAVAEKARFIESDLNRSYGSADEPSLESKLADQIVIDIDEQNPDLIIDLHTSTVDVNEVAIVAEPNANVLSFVKALGMDYVAVMPETINQTTLIGQFRKKGLALEFGVGLRSDELANNVADRINKISNGQLDNQDKIIRILKIERLIEKREAIETELFNYEYNDKLGGYPFLTGKNNYDEHAGFLAHERTEI